jgi:predicted transcriptional regulator YheO
MKKHPLSRYTSIADAITRLFHPNAEVVIHDIQSDNVFYIAGTFSGRKPGDISLLKLDDQNVLENETVIGPYEKVGEKGQRIRSVTSVLRDDDGVALGLMCINLDYSVYEPVLDLLEGLIRPIQTHAHPEMLFQNDWRDQIKLEIRSYLLKNNLTLETLTPESRKKMVAHLNARGLFYAKKSIEQLAGILGVSRATAYNSLKAVRATSGPVHTNRRK